MGYKLSRKAVDDIIHLYREGAAQFGAAQAERYHSGLEESFAFLAANPEAARVRTELEPAVRIHRYISHMIIYTIEGDEILIIRVRHGREDWTKTPV